MSVGPDNPNRPDVQAAREKMELPGLMLLIVGVFNLLLSLFLLFGAIQSFRLSEEEMERRWELMSRVPGMNRVLEEDSNLTVKTLRRRSQIISTVWAVLSVWAASMVLLAGIRMRAMRSFGLVVMGSFLAAVPFVSCTGCCGMGQLAGAWAIVVLLDPNVRLLFR